MCEAEAVLFRKIYLAGVLVTFVYLMAFDNYSDGNWTTQGVASLVAAMLWPVYWAIIRWF